MADKIIKLKPNSLSSIQSDANGLFYALRYRVISEDKNRYSFWSPILRIDMPDLTTVTDSYKVHSSTTGQTPKIINISWTQPEPVDYAEFNTFDVFIRWKDNASNPLTDWILVGTVTSKSFALIVPNDSSYKKIDVDIQLESVARTRVENLVAFRIQNHNI